MIRKVLQLCKKDTIISQAQSWVDDATLEECLPRLWRAIFMKELFQRWAGPRNKLSMNVNWKTQFCIAPAIYVNLAHDSISEVISEQFELLWPQYISKLLVREFYCSRLRINLS